MCCSHSYSWLVSILVNFFFCICMQFFHFTIIFYYCYVLHYLSLFCAVGLMFMVYSSPFWLDSIFFCDQWTFSFFPNLNNFLWFNLVPSIFFPYSGCGHCLESSFLYGCICMYKQHYHLHIYVNVVNMWCCCFISCNHGVIITVFN